MATLYFNGADDIANGVPPDWNNLDNWWLNSGHTTPATSLPTSSDSVVASASIMTNSGSSPTVVNLTITDSNLAIEVTVTGMATFNSSELYYPDGSIIGNVTFNGSSVCKGSVDGHAVFNNTSYVGFPNTLGGTLDSLTFNDYSIARDIFLSGALITITFNDYAVCAPDSDLNFGNCTVVFNDYSSVSNPDYRRQEGSSGRMTTGNSATVTFKDNSMYWVDQNSAGGSQWTFMGNAVNNSQTDPVSAATFLPNRGINGSSILGLI